MFQSIQDLPSLIRTHLPSEAQELYRAAFNRTWETLAAGEDDPKLSITVESHKAALQAVESEFSQDRRGRWRRDSVGDDMDRR